MTSVELFWEVSRRLIYPGNALVIICFLLFYSKRTLDMKVLGFYSVSSTIFHFAQVLATGAMVNFVGTGWTLTEQVLFSLFYFLVIPLKGYRNWIVFSCILYIVFYVIALTFYPTSSYSYIRTARDLIIMLYALSYFFYLLKNLPEENLLGLPMFWINVGVIFFFSSTFILSLFRDYIVIVLKDDMMGFWGFRNFLRFGFCLILSYGGWLDLRVARKASLAVR